MITIRITDLKLRAIIGIQNWERAKKQEVVINVAFSYNAAKAIQSDKIKDAIDYKALTKAIIQKVEKSRFFLLERLAADILNMVLKDRRIKEARVRVDKPLALRFADSVSVELSRKQK